MEKVELCAPAGNLSSLKAALENGADAIYMSLDGVTNLRNFPGLNFTRNELVSGLGLVHEKGKRLFLAVNSFPQDDRLGDCYKAIDTAAEVGVDAVILSDFALLDYTRKTYPELKIHLSVQSHISNYESIEFMEKRFNIKRVVLPRILNLEELRQLRQKTTVEIEVFAVGLLCINCEGLCYLSSFLTGESINTYGACSAPKFVDFNYEENELTVRSNNVILARYSEKEKGAYPTPCKGVYHSPDNLKKIFQDSESLNVLDILPELLGSGVNALKLEGRQRSRAYVAKVTSVFRSALDSYYTNRQPAKSDIEGLFEGMAPSYGCYKKKGH